MIVSLLIEQYEFALVESCLSVFSNWDAFLRKQLSFNMGRLNLYLV